MREQDKELIKIKEVLNTEQGKILIEWLLKCYGEIIDNNYINDPYKVYYIKGQRDLVFRLYKISNLNVKDFAKVAEKIYYEDQLKIYNQL